MGADEVQANPEQFGALAQQALVLANSIQQVVNAVADSIASSKSSAPWGRDDMGNTFLNGTGNNGFSASADSLNTGGGQLVATLRYYGNGLTESGTLLDAGETEAAAAFQQASAQLPESRTPWMRYTGLVE